MALSTTFYLMKKLGLNDVVYLNSVELVLERYLFFRDASCSLVFLEYVNEIINGCFGLVGLFTALPVG